MGVHIQFFEEAFYLRRFLDRKYEESRRMAAPPLDSSVRSALAAWLDD